jgi:hypothetical protein
MLLQRAACARPAAKSAAFTAPEEALIGRALAAP